MNKLFPAYLLLIVLLFAGCEKENMGDCFKSTGKTVRESRAVERFSTIEIDDRINLYITYSNERSLEVEAGENLQEFIRTEVKNGTLWIENDNRCNWVRSYKKDINVYLSTNELTELIYRGSGNVEYTNLFKTERFNLDMWRASGNVYLQLDCPNIELKSHTGPVDLQCRGFGNKLVAYTNGLGKMNTTHLIAKDVLAVNANSGQLSVRSDSILNANIDGNGDILYSGNPSIELKDNGKGDLIEIN